ncbi:MAG: hypothetical protein ACI4KK_00900 [Lentihominibacter sp.]
MVDLKRLNGSVSVGEIMFNYNVSMAPASKVKYTNALKVSMIDPLTAEIMQDKHRMEVAINKLEKKMNALDDEDEKSKVLEEIEKIRSGKKKFNIEKYKYLQDDELTEKKIKGYALGCAEKLYAQYERELMKKLKETPKVGQVNAIQLFHIYANDYLISLGSCATRTAEDRKRALRNACNELGKKGINYLTEKELEKFFNNEKFLKKRKLIEGFFDYCMIKGPFMTVNPIRKFFEEHTMQKKGKKVKFYPKNSRHLSFEQETALNDIIDKHKNDKEIMAVVLAKYARLSINEIKNIVWGDICIFDIGVLIKLIDEEKSGNFHDRTRPILGGGVEFVKERYYAAQKKINDDEKFKNTKVISKRKKKNEKGEPITKYIRNIMNEAKVYEINELASRTRELGGAGISLLHDHYDYVLERRCGVILDSPVGRFLRGYNPGDVMHQHYRSLTDVVSGIPYLMVIMRRDDLFSSSNETISVQAEIEHVDGITYIHIPPPGPGKKINVIIPEIKIKKGTEIVISSTYGVRGEISFKGLKSTKQKVEERKIY